MLRSQMLLSPESVRTGWSRILRRSLERRRMTMRPSESGDVVLVRLDDAASFLLVIESDLMRR